MAKLAVDAKSLKIAFAHKISDRASSSDLSLYFEESDKHLKLSSDRLPLHFSRKISDRPAASALQLLFMQKHDIPDSNDNGNETPEKRRMDGLLSCTTAKQSQLHDVCLCYSARYDSDQISMCYPTSYSDAVIAGACFNASTDSLSALQKCTTNFISDNVAIARCHHFKQDETIAQNRCSISKYSDSKTLNRCTSEYLSATQSLLNCTNSLIKDSFPVGRCTNAKNSATLEIMRCQHESYKEAVPVPCEWYPVPLPDPEPDDGAVCRPRPPSSRLPLTFTRKLMPWRDSRLLPLPFACWHDDKSNSIPILGTYMIDNTINCTIDGINVDILSASIKTDMQSYCWQGEVRLSPTDFSKINLNKDKGDEPAIDITINGTHFVFALEDVRDNRQFINYSYTLSGRSLTSRLGADYAKARAGLVGSSIYARQIADQVLQFTDCTITEWSIPDWLVPADTYDQSNKTPLAIIAEIAHAAGGFVMSDRVKQELYIKPRWKKTAWEIAGAIVDKEIPSSVIESISGQKQTKPRYNAVRLHGNSEGKLVYRQNEDKSKDAGTQSSVLYSDDSPMISAGKAILSDSGNHKVETIKLPWAKKYNIDLAELGDIWQVNENSDNWRGAVQSVSISVNTENDAPVVYQTVVLDRYLDE